MKYILIALINLYQKMPLHSHSYCRFTPTCSEYAKISLKKYGFFKGSYLAVKRIIRCHPGGKSGIDLVP